MCSGKLAHVIVIDNKNNIHWFPNLGSYSYCFKMAFQSSTMTNIDQQYIQHINQGHIHRQDAYIS